MDSQDSTPRSDRSSVSSSKRYRQSAATNASPLFLQLHQRRNRGVDSAAHSYLPHHTSRNLGSRGLSERYLYSGRSSSDETLASSMASSELRHDAAGLGLRHGVEREDDEDDDADMMVADEGNSMCSFEDHLHSQSIGSGSAETRGSYESDPDTHPDEEGRSARRSSSSGNPKLWPLLEELTSLEKELTREAARLRERWSSLKSREQTVLELEQLASRSHNELAQCAEQEVTVRWQKLEEERRDHTQGLLDLIKARDSDVHRLEVSFATMKEANDLLKEKVSFLEDENSQLLKQLSSTHRRLKNLQARTKIQEQRRRNVAVVDHTLTVAKQEQRQSRDASKVSSAAVKSSLSETTHVLQESQEKYIEPFCSLLEWIVDAQLMQKWRKIQQGPMKITAEEFQRQCARLLPLVVDLLTKADVTTAASQIIIPCLRFALMSSRIITHATVSSAVQSQRASLLMMFRHLGEAMTRAKDTNHVAIIASASWHVQLLSSMFVLANVNRTDLVLMAFDVLRNSLRSAVQKNTFLSHQGMAIIVTFMRSSTAKALVSAAVDVHLHLVNEAAVLDRFLSACGNDEWFHSTACLLRHHKDYVMAEKLSIVLQKLAQLPSAHRYFVSHQLVPIAEQVTHSCGLSHSFLVLNLRSIIASITAAIKSPSKSQQGMKA